MIPAKRRQMILEYIQDNNIVEIDRICDTFHVSISTVHRDLTYLQKEGLLQKVRGGASVHPIKNFETPLDNRIKLYMEEKKRIAEYALRFVSNDMSLILDNSTTALAVAKLLGVYQGLTVITYFQEIICELSKPRYQVSLLSTGGELNRIHQTFVGSLVESALAEIHVPLAFISAVGVSPELGIMHPLSDECRRKQLIIQAADEVILLVDHSKFTKTALNIVAPLEKISKIITDQGLDPSIAKKYEEQGVELHIAN
jgi:DeoR family transcriptional regulator, fructose operon transcriptional repressor